MNLLNDINSPDMQSVTFNSQKGNLTEEIVQEKSKETPQDDNANVTHPQSFS